MLRPTLTLAVILLIGACAQVEVEKPPPEPAPDPNAGQLTLPSGAQSWLLPDDLEVSGRAHYRWPDGKTYDGDWASGLPHGTGTMTLPSGDSYAGTWQSGQRHGHGEQTLADGTHYVGEFVSNMRQGEGAERSADGLYRGKWHRDLPHGRGEFFGADGSEYRGQWDAGERHGTGTYKDTRGSTYEGDWASDKPHGFGQLTAPDGSEYAGSWSAGARDGYGSSRDASGVRYAGTWVNDQRQGYGEVTRPDGTSYEGEWLADKRHGQGRETTSTGAYHEGTWERNLPLGPGTRTDTSGIAISGLWNRDQVTTGLLALPTGPEYAGPLFSQKNTRVSSTLQAWLEQNAHLGDPYAALVLGRVFSDFSVPQPDPALATKYLKSAAAASIAEAQYRLALGMVETRPPRAMELLMQAADGDLPEANALLGRWYLNGEIVPPDSHIALRYLRRGAELGDIAATNDLAWLLATRDGVLDPARAIALIEPIAEFLRRWQHLDTLAAAYASNGDFGQAVSTQSSAIKAAQADIDMDPRTLQQMQQRLERYQRNEPYLESQS